jgi:imidazole glycerol-phosphate synthase subunit HisH
MQLWRAAGWKGGDRGPRLDPRRRARDDAADPDLKIPQIGWNTIHVKHSHKLLDGIATGEDGLHAYFVHSYQLDAERDDDVVAVTDYGGPVTAIVAATTWPAPSSTPKRARRSAWP